MKWIDIAGLPTVSGDANEHESIFQAYQILDKVKYYLRCDVPSDIILELIDEVQK